MIHPHYLSSKRWITSKTGQHYNYYEANSKTQLALFNLGYKYYSKTKLGSFGTYSLVKILSYENMNKEITCLVQNTINFVFIVNAKDLILNEY